MTIKTKKLRGGSGEPERCDTCGWPLSQEPAGCRPGDCSQRPLPRCSDCGKVFSYSNSPGRCDGSCKSLEARVADWVRTRIGPEHMNRKERAMRLLEEAIELAQSEGVSWHQAAQQIAHVYQRPAGDPSQEMGGVLVCALAWCAATGNALQDLAMREIERIEAKPIDQIRGSLARKHDADLVTCLEGK